MRMCVSNMMLHVFRIKVFVKPSFNSHCINNILFVYFFVTENVEII